MIGGIPEIIGAVRFTQDPRHLLSLMQSGKPVSDIPRIGFELSPSALAAEDFVGFQVVDKPISEGAYRGLENVLTEWCNRCNCHKFTKWTDFLVSAPTVMVVQAQKQRHPTGMAAVLSLAGAARRSQIPSASRP